MESCFENLKKEINKGVFVIFLSLGETILKSTCVLYLHKESDCKAHNFYIR